MDRVVSQVKIFFLLSQIPLLFIFLFDIFSVSPHLRKEFLLLPVDARRDRWLKRFQSGDLYYMLYVFSFTVRLYIICISPLVLLDSNAT